MPAGQLWVGCPNRRCCCLGSGRGGWAGLGPWMLKRRCDTYAAILNTLKRGHHPNLADVKQLSGLLETSLYGESDKVFFPQMHLSSRLPWWLSGKGSTCNAGDED